MSYIVLLLPLLDANANTHDADQTTNRRTSACVCVYCCWLCGSLPFRLIIGLAARVDERTTQTKHSATPADPAKRSTTRGSFSVPHTHIT